MRHVLFCMPLLCTAALSPALGAESARIGGDILLQADQVIYDVNKQVVTAQGHVEVDYESRILMAETLTYDQTTDTMVASGHVSMLDAKGNVAFADHVTLTDKMREGALDGFAALYGFPRWLSSLTETLPQGQPLPNLADLLQEKCERLLQQVCMPVQGG